MPADDVREPFDGTDLVMGSDGLPVRDVGVWSKDKHHFLGSYIEVFTNAMKSQRWLSGLGYIDLFAGPGRCRVRTTGEEIDASPLIALRRPRPKKAFDSFSFADMSSDALEAIKARFRSAGATVMPRTYAGDCNTTVERIAEDLNPSFLHLAFIDPTGLDIHFDTVRELTAHRRVDLIIAFMDRLDLNRNVESTYFPKNDSKPDYFFGQDSGWRDAFSGIGNWNAENLTKAGLKVYQKQLRSIGYEHFGDPVRIEGLTGNTAQPFYLLLFASRHPRGVQFWDEVSRKDRGGQRSFRFGE